MARPLRDPIYQQNDKEPVINPELYSIEGEGKGDGQPVGNLSSAIPHDELEQAEMGNSPLRSIDGSGEGDGIPRGNLGVAGEKKRLGLYNHGVYDNGRPNPMGLTDAELFNAEDNLLPPQARVIKFVRLLFGRKKVGVGMGGTVAIGILIFVASIVQGPLELIHIGENLKLFHLSARDREVDISTVRTARYIYYLKKGSGVENLRMGILGNYVANKIDAKMQAAGIETAYSAKSGYREGYFFDPDKLTISEFDQYKKYDSKGRLNLEATQKGIIEGFEKEFGVKPEVQSDGRLFVDSTDSRLYGSYKFDRMLQKATGYYGVSGAINARIMGKRAGLGWHPIKKLDRKLALKAEEAYKNWRDKEKNYVVNGEQVEPSASNGTKDDPDKTPEENEANKSSADNAVDTALELARDAEEIAEGAEGERQSNLEKFAGNTGAKVAVGGASAVGVICMVKTLADSSAATTEKKIKMPLIRIFGSMISIGSQLKSGDDIDMVQVGYYKKQLRGIDSSGKKSSYAGAATNKAHTGSSGGTEPTDTMKKMGQGSPFDFINEGAVGSVANASCSTAGMVATTIIGVASGGVISAVVGTVAGIVAGPIIQNQLVDWLTGNPQNPIPVGGDRGNASNFGGRLASRAMGASNGGRELSSSETADNFKSVEEAEMEDFRATGFANRVFNIYDTKSVFGSLINSSNVSSEGLASVLSQPGALFSNLFFTRAYAAENTYPYPVDDIGFTNAELANKKLQNPFQNAEDVVKNIMPAHPDYVDRGKKCFGATIDPSSYDITSIESEDPTIKDTKSAECTDKSEAYLQFRFYVLTFNTLLANACYEGNDEACQEISGSQSAQAESTGDSADDAGFEIKKLDSSMHTPGGKVSPVKGITLHWWGSQYGKGIRPLVDALESNPSCGSGGCSVQLGITSQGEVYQLTRNLNDLTYHAIGANKTTIGIEIEGGPKEFGKDGIEKYPEKFEAVVKTVKYLMKKYDIKVEGAVSCGDVEGIHAHLEYNKCPGAGGKDDIDNYYFNEVIKRVKE